MLGQSKFTARLGILITAAACHKHRHSARKGSFQIVLSEPGVVSAELIEAERRIVAGVSKQQCFQFACFRFNLQDGNIMIHGSIRIGGVSRFCLCRKPSIHSEACAAVGVADFSWLKVLECGAHQLKDLLFEVVVVILCM